jgi:DNA polymerase-3 subunit gamma/tau
MLGQWFQQSELVGYEANPESLMLQVRVPVRPFTEPALLAKVKDALRSHFGVAVRLEVTLGEVAQTAQAAEQQAKSDRLDAARQALEQDPAVQALLADFEARIVPESVRPSEPH